MKKGIFRILKWVICAVLLLVIGLLGWLTVTEYRPDEIIPAEVQASEDVRTLSVGTELTMLSFNVGYGGLGAESDFFMDGGKMVDPPSQEIVERNLNGIAGILSAQNPDICFLQEVDARAARTGKVDERLLLARGSWAYALNYQCKFVPFPLPPIGQVTSGVMTTAALDLSDSVRVTLLCPFSWPVRVANLKRCMLVTRLPLEGSAQELVLVNFHLEAYDDGEGKRMQTEQLRALLEQEYAAGNCVIAGGDWNQTFPGSLERWPMLDPDLWTPGVLSESDWTDGWRYAYDAATPTCRLLNQPYDAADPMTQYYVIDGFVLSPNVELLGVETLDCGFAFSDHNPVRMEVRLGN